MVIDIQSELLKIHSLGLLEKILIDRTTKSPILWATDVYREYGEDYRRDKEITEQLITWNNSQIIKSRVRKELEQQSERTRQRGEVFTPLWVCEMMINYVDEGVNVQNANWKKYVDRKCLEITCGEAPYLVSRYDVSNGKSIPIKNRIGILDRKLQIVNENTINEKEWLKWTIRAFQSTYGYEFQGDNLLIARVNLLLTFEEYLQARWERKPTFKEYQEILKIITWNVWQMDGLTNSLPYCKAQDEFLQMSIFDYFSNENKQDEEKEVSCRIYDWRSNHSMFYQDVNKGGRGMKFDIIIGNPPYQEETIGDNKGFAPPIYHKFIDNAYKVAEIVELIHPARFLFNAGSTPKTWNEQMLNDSHLKILYYEQNASKIFNNTEIKGGVAISYHDIKKDFGAIKVFSPYNELNDIMKKAAPVKEENSLTEIIYIQNKFDLDVLYAEHPEFEKEIGSAGKDKRFRNNIFDKISEFTDERKLEDDIRVLGVSKNKRQWKYIRKRYVDLNHENIDKWKVLVARVNGSGALGEVLSSPLIVEPNEGYTQTFIGIGAFEDKDTAENALKYVKSKFARTMLGILKITQDNNRDTWKMVPLQDFTKTSDIDWSKSITEIDQQLYKKYGLNEKEIEFIETHVKEMV